MCLQVIDTHVHFSNIQSFSKTAKEISYLDYSKAGFEEEFSHADVVYAVAMGLQETCPGSFPDHSAANPMMIDLNHDRPQRLACCPGINPMQLRVDRRKELEQIAAVLSEPWVVGIKIYAGYYPFYVHDPIYSPVYDLAEKFQLPVVIHGGATYARNALLKYSHPLEVDELAVQRPNIKLVIAHLGDPWVMDTAAVCAKDLNVYSDLSGLFVTDSFGLEQVEQNDLLVNQFKKAMVYTDNYSKFLFGSDWPLAPVAPYIRFVQSLVPAQYHQQVFYENALDVFGRLDTLIVKR